jgi:glycosyltransferase involved in cell wall biosynthesis
MSSTAYYGYSQELARQGVDVTVVSAYLAPRRSTAGLQQTREGDVEIYKLPVTTFVKKSLAPTRFALQAFSLVDRLQGENPFDVLQLQAFPNLGLVLFPTGRTPRVTVLDIRTSAISGGFFNALSKLVLRLQARLFQHVIVLDRHLVSFLFDEHQRRVTIVPLGANFRQFQPGRDELRRQLLGLGPGDLVFIYTGNIDAVRTIDKMVRAFTAVAEKHPHIRLLLLGEGDQRWHLQSLVEKRGLSHRVTFTGVVPYAEIPSYLRAADVGIAYVPDKVQYRNQPPLKTAEYLATGLPVLATDTPGNRRFVQPGRNGLLAEDTVEALKKGLTCLVEERDLRREMAQVARESVRQFSYEQIVSEQLLPYYERCLSARGAE